MNTPKFKLGETVIALTRPRDNHSQQRVVGNSYTVHALRYCTQCGEQSINIGQSTEPDSITNCKCGAKHPSEGKGWTSSRHFARPSELQPYLEHAVTNEDYETAAIIRDIINDVKTQL